MSSLPLVDPKVSSSSMTRFSPLSGGCGCKVFPPNGFRVGKNCVCGFFICATCLLIFWGFVNVFSIQRYITLPFPRQGQFDRSQQLPPFQRDDAARLQTSLTTVSQRPDLGAPNITTSVYNVTLVSAYIDIGEFGKGAPNRRRDHRIYETWSRPFSKILAPLIFFTDSPSFAEHMRHVRANLSHLTEIVHVNRSRLWAFQQREAIARIYTGNYPKHWPNTVYPDYTCLTHAKFDFLMEALEASRFPPTPHVAWMDVGYLRDVVSAPYPAFYTLRPPPAFNASRVLCGEVNRPKFQQPWQSIFRGNLNWVAGGFFLATRDVMNTFVLQYRRAVTSFLQKNESNVEQHVLYAMYTDSGRALVKPEVEFQVVSSPAWFNVGYLCLQGQNVSTISSPGPRP